MDHKLLLLATCFRLLLYFLCESRCIPGAMVVNYQLVVMKNIKMAIPFFSLLRCQPILTLLATAIFLHPVQKLNY
jgi:hypothetical protein